jgi:PKD repeat protein
VNPGDQVVVQKIKIVNGSSTINSVSIRNLGTADENDIVKIFIDDDADPFTNPLAEYTDLAGLRSGLHFAFDYTVPSGTSYLWIGVEIAGADQVAGGETIQFEVRFYASTYTSPYIVDGSPEEIFKGGFERKRDDSPSPRYLNPGDPDVLVQRAFFTDDDGNDTGVTITKVMVSNLEDADSGDIADVKVEITVDGTTYVANKGGAPTEWDADDPVVFLSTNFPPNLPAAFPDDAEVKVEVMVTVAGTTDKHKIRTETTLETTEADGPYQQSLQASTTHTIRVQGFEKTQEISDPVPSGVKSAGEVLIQKVKVTDSDVNNNDVTANGIWIKNLGTATADDIAKIEVKRMDTGVTLLTINSGDIQNFDSGHLYPFTTTWNVPDDGSATLGIYYTVANDVTPGVTLQPQVYIRGQENGTNYPGDKVTYPDAIALYPHGFETVANVSPPEGGTAYSGQRLLVQKIRCVDIDENNDGVRINPVRVKNIATNPCLPSEIEKIEVRTEDGTLLGETTDIDGLLAGGVVISTLSDNLVPDDQEVFLYIYVTFAGPEDVTAGHKLKLETTVFFEEDGHVGNRTVTGPEWTLEINNRPVVNFDWTPENPKWSDNITFTPSVSDPDGDAIVWSQWDFGDGTDPITRNGPPQTVTHQYPNGGTFTVTLTVKDARGLTGTKSKQITVEERPNQPPTADFSWTPAEPEAGEEVTFTATAEDPDDPPDTPLTYAWDFGDGATLPAAEDNQEVTHTYTNPGTYTVTLTVRDARGAETQVGKEITVAAPVNEPPTITSLNLDPEDPVTGQEVTFNATATDPEDDAIVAWQWDFDGDGNVDSTQAPPVTHTYDQEGVYTVRVRAKDEGSDTWGPWYERSVYVRRQGGPEIGGYVERNPVSTQATIVYFLPAGATNVKLSIFDLMGRLVFEANLNPAANTYTWNLQTSGGTGVPSGVYFFVITAEKDGRTIRSAVGRILVVR